MNISPVSLVNFKSSARNVQSSKQANEVKAISPIKYANASSEDLKANFCPQVAFSGEDDSNKTVKLSNAMVQTLQYYVKNETGKPMEQNLAVKLRLGTATQKELFDTLKLRKGEWLVAQSLAGISTDEYINITNKLDDKYRLALLKMARDKKHKHTIAHTLAINPEEYVKATEGFSKKDRIKLLNMKDSYGCSVAHNLAEHADWQERLVPLSAVIKGFNKDELAQILTITNNKGESVEDTLRKANKSAPIVLKNIFDIK